MPCPNYVLRPWFRNSCIIWGGGVIRISDKSSGINPAATRGFTGEKGVDGDVTTEVTGVDKEQTKDVTTEPEMGVTTAVVLAISEEDVTTAPEMGVATTVALAVS